MNIIKVNFNNKTKKIVMKEEYKNFELFKDVISQITKYPISEMTISFHDLEDEEIIIEDVHDLEYFFEQDRQNMSLFVSSEESFVRDELEQIQEEIKELKLREYKEREESDNIPLIYKPKMKKQIESLFSNNTQKKVAKNKERNIVNNYSSKIQKKIKKMRKMMERQLEKIEFDLEKLNLKDLKKTNQKIVELKRGEKIIFQKSSDITVENLTLHRGVKCDHCQKDVVGKRYKCVVCQDFDLCQTCEAQTIHDHPMMRLMTPIKDLDLKKMLSQIEENPIVDREEKSELIDTFMDDKSEVEKQDLLSQYSNMTVQEFYNVLQQTLAK